jgi:hypothetical protein
LRTFGGSFTEVGIGHGTIMDIRCLSLFGKFCEIIEI